MNTAGPGTGRVAIQIATSEALRDQIDALAKSLDLNRGGVIARAVELYEQLTRAKRAGCAVVVRHPQAGEMPLEFR